MTGIKHTYDVFRSEDGTLTKVAENVERKYLKEYYGLPGDKILYAARHGKILQGKFGKYRIRLHRGDSHETDNRPKTICHVSAVRTSSGCRFGG